MLGRLNIPNFAPRKGTTKILFFCILMKKLKYYYDPQTLSFNKVVKRKRTWLARVLLFLLSSAIFGSLVIFILFNTRFFFTPREIVQQREIRQYEVHLGLLNKKMEQMEQVLQNIEERDNNLYRLYFEAPPIPVEQRRSGFGGSNRYKDLEKFDNLSLLIDATKRLEILQKQLVIQSQSLDEITKLARDKEKLMSSIPTIQPIRNEDLTHMASGYGWRSDPFTKIRKFHHGMDFVAPRGTPIYATGDGVVTRADNKSSGYGEHIRINHGYGYETLYAHLSRYNVRPGQKVKRGDLIGYVGSTGRSQAPHLHYEVHKDGETVNPINFYYGSLTSEEYDKLTKRAEQENQSLD